MSTQCVMRQIGNIPCTFVVTAGNLEAYIGDVKVTRIVGLFSTKIPTQFWDNARKLLEQAHLSYVDGTLTISPTLLGGGGKVGAMMQAQLPQEERLRLFNTFYDYPEALNLAFTFLGRSQQTYEYFFRHYNNMAKGFPAATPLEILYKTLLEIEKRCELDNYHVLCSLALLAPSEIPEGIIEDYIKGNPENPIAILTELKLLTKMESGNYALSPQLQNEIKNGLTPEEIEQVFTSNIQSLAKRWKLSSFEGGFLLVPPVWASHVKSLISHAPKNYEYDATAALLLKQVGEHFFDASQFKDAERCLMLALTELTGIVSKSGDLNSELVWPTADTAKSLGLLYRIMGNFSEAIGGFSTWMHIHPPKTSAEKYETALLFGDANFLSKLYAAAKEWYLQALPNCQSGQDIYILNKLGTTCHLFGELDQAIAHFEKALERSLEMSGLSEEAFAQQVPECYLLPAFGEQSTGRTRLQREVILNNLGAVRMDKGDLKEAEKRFGEAWMLIKEKHGEFHPETKKVHERVMFVQRMITNAQTTVISQPLPTHQGWTFK